jgi:hypothetical protein
MNAPLSHTPIAPVRHRLELALPRERAFALFTRSIGRWWPFKGHSCSGERARDVVFEERVGGAVVEIAADGTRHRWGTLLRWDPPQGFEMSWHPGQAESVATRLAVRFVAHRGGGCELQLEHGGWEARGDDASAVRDGYDRGWGPVLGCYVAWAAQEQAS